MSILAALPPPSVLLEPANLVGSLALISSCVWPLLERRKAIFTVQVAGSVLFALHYLILGASTAAAMCLAGVFQGLAVVLLSNRLARIGVVGGLVAATMGATALTWSGLPSLMSQLGQMAGAIGRLQMNTQRLRLCFLVSVLFWTTHNLMVGSVFGLGADTLSLTALLVGLWRNRRGARVQAQGVAVAAN